MGEGLEEIYEIRIRKVEDLSPNAQKEVRAKLEKTIETNESFRYKGYAKVIYARASPLRVISVDPIEGTIIDYFKELNNTVFQG